MNAVIKIGAPLLLALGLVSTPAMAWHRGHAAWRPYHAPRHVVYYAPPRAYYAPPRVVYRAGYYPAPRPIWVRGARYYGPGYGPTYVVNDWGGYGLAPPPYGYYWRRDGVGNFLLVAATTGIITDLILHH